MPLLGRDHLTRGQGPIMLFNKAFFTLADVPAIVVSALLLFTDRGPNLASAVFGDIDTLLTEPLAADRPFQAWLIFGGITLYFLKVFFWSWTYSHSNTVGVGSAIFVALGYHLFVVLSICLAAYQANRMPTTWEIANGAAVFCIALLHETLADRELADFKKRKTGGLLQYGYHSICRHPNYFFNTFSFPCIALMSGSYPVFALWVFVQVFWAHAQSGVALETYMASKYGAEWESYCKSVPFFFPKFGDLINVLIFKHVGVKSTESTKMN